MSLDIDVSRVPRNPLELRKLTHAVESASEEDEAEWIEWKANLDLGAKDTRATLARHIIGFANRRVDEAARFMEGFGFLLVGIEPGNRHGVVRPDLADLAGGIESFLGPRGPRWTASYDTELDASVLVIVVDPPQQGDPIHTLHRDFAKYRAGDIFVRKSARTERAGPGDVEYLAQRATPTRAQLDLGVSVIPNELTAPPLVGLDQSIESWLNEQREILSRCKRHRDAIESYLANCRNELTVHIYLEYIRQVENMFELEINNPTDRNLTDVEVKLEFPTGVKIANCQDSVFRGPFKLDYSTNDMWWLLKLGDADVFDERLLKKPEYWFRQAMVVHVKDLRPQVTYRERFHVVVTGPRLPEVRVPMRWAATATNVDGHLAGEFPFRLNGQPIRASELVSDKLSTLRPDWEFED